jgi:hypothetical protein
MLSVLATVDKQATCQIFNVLDSRIAKVLGDVVPVMVYRVKLGSSGL